MSNQNSNNHSNHQSGEKEQTNTGQPRIIAYPNMHAFTVPEIAAFTEEHKEEVLTHFQQGPGRQILETESNRIATVSTRSANGPNGRDLVSFGVHTGENRETISGDRDGDQTWALRRWKGRGDFDENPEYVVYVRDQVPDKEAKAAVVDFLGNCLVCEYSHNNIHQQRLNAWLESNGDYSPSPIRYLNAGPGTLFELLAAVGAARNRA